MAWGIWTIQSGIGNNAIEMIHIEMRQEYSTALTDAEATITDAATNHSSILHLPIRNIVYFGTPPPPNSTGS